MELTVTNKQVPSVEVVYDGCAEQPVECDLLLPDYCPDIVRILKCTVTPVLRRKQQSGTTLTLEGDAQIRVYYISEDPAQICSADTTLPFTKNIELSSRNPAGSCPGGGCRLHRRGGKALFYSGDL